MLHIRKLGGGPGLGKVAHYYSETLGDDPTRRPDEYYLAADRDARSQWFSPGSLLVEDGSAVTPERLRQAMEGKGATGRSLVQKAARGDRVAGWDATFSAPKPASVAWATADPAMRRAIAADVLDSAREALGHWHSTGAFETRYGGGGKHRGPAQSIMAGLFPHFTNRNADPQLHVHAVIVNLAVRPDGKTGSLESRKLFETTAATGELFRRSLASRLAARGLGIETPKPEPGRKMIAGDFDIAGLPRELVASLSSRHRQVQEIAAAKPEAPMTRKRLQSIAMTSRARKASLLQGADLEARWRQDVERHGQTPASLWLAIREAGNSLAQRAQRLKQSMGETLAMVRDKGGAMAQAVGQRLRLVGQGRSMLPALHPDMQRAVALYGRKVREGMPLADAVSRFTAHDARSGQPARAAEWQARLSAAAKAPSPAMEQQPVRQMTRGMHMSR